MLINRTIDKPKEKFKLLENYILNNNDIKRIYSKEYSSLLYYPNIFLAEDQICKILSISSKTLRNWTKKSEYRIKVIRSYQTFSNTLLQEELFSKHLPVFDRSNERYYSLEGLYQFLYFQKIRNSEYIIYT